jgi:hypothetical protein
MTIHEFNTARWLPRGREEVVALFAEAQNLQAITPLGSL